MVHEKTGGNIDYVPSTRERLLMLAALVFMAASIFVGSIEILRWGYSLLRGFCQ